MKNNYKEKIRNKEKECLEVAPKFINSPSLPLAKVLQILARIFQPT
jgi:hypothetical protein